MQQGWEVHHTTAAAAAATHSKDATTAAKDTDATRYHTPAAAAAAAATHSRVAIAAAKDTSATRLGGTPSTPHMHVPTHAPKQVGDNPGASP